MLARWPSMVVVMLGPEFNSVPFKLQVMVIGMSPCDTTHVNWAKTPVFTTGDPNENGTMTGGSGKNHSLYSILG